MRRHAIWVWMMMCLGVMTSSPLIAAGLAIQPIKEGISHEAWVDRVTGNELLDAIPSKPPAPINERRPSNVDRDLVWLEGYWAWSKERADFVWVSGVWRKPPPDHRWISGFWKEFQAGWVWIRGFWSKNAERDLTYLDQAPPDPKDEQVGTAPSKDHFWVAGYWDYDASQHDYVWVQGAWQKVDPDWVLVPAHYVWSPEGYILIPYYWDWPMDKRGKLYNSIWIDPQHRVGMSYTPAILIDPWVWFERCYLCWPDYGYCYHWHWHCCEHWWGWCDCYPQWWGWSTWWALPWHHCWDLWWWWGHPGWHHPIWMTHAMAQHIHGPLNALLGLWQGVLPPFFLSPNGLIPPWNFLKALPSIVGPGLPLLPLQPDILKDIQDSLKPPSTIQPLLPSGDPDADVELLKPNVDLGAVQIVPQEAPRLELPSRPEIKETPKTPEMPPIRTIDVPETPRYPRPNYRPSDDDHSGHDHSGHDHSGHDHGQRWPRPGGHHDHGHRWPRPGGHDDHSGHDHGQRWPRPGGHDDHSGHDHGQGGHRYPKQPKTPWWLNPDNWRQPEHEGHDDDHQDHDHGGGYETPKYPNREEGSNSWNTNPQSEIEIYNQKQNHHRNRYRFRQQHNGEIQIQGQQLWRQNQNQGQKQQQQQQQQGEGIQFFFR